MSSCALNIVSRTMYTIKRRWLNERDVTKGKVTGNWLKMTKSHENSFSQVNRSKQPNVICTFHPAMICGGTTFVNRLTILLVIFSGPNLLSYSLVSLGLFWFYYLTVFSGSTIFRVLWLTVAGQWDAYRVDENLACCLMTPSDGVLRLKMR